jgi:hypothetical protein
MMDMKNAATEKVQSSYVGEEIRKARERKTRRYAAFVEAHKNLTDWDILDEIEWGIREGTLDPEQQVFANALLAERAIHY